MARVVGSYPACHPFESDRRYQRSNFGRFFIFWTTETKFEYGNGFVLQTIYYTKSSNTSRLALAIFKNQKQLPLPTLEIRAFFVLARISFRTCRLKFICHNQDLKMFEKSGLLKFRALGLPFTVIMTQSRT